jgi:hypothetical protein
MYIEQMFRTAEFLEYAGEQQLMDGIIMNFHPSILAQAALDRPRTLKEFYQVVGSIEVKFSVSKERQRMEGASQLRAVVGLAPVLLR